MSFQPIEAPADICVAEAIARLGREGRPGVCDTGRYLCRYALWGEGPPIVFVHGLGDLARSFAMVAAELCRDFTCILYELPTGESDNAGLGGYRHRHFAADLIALLDHLQLERTYLFGSSFGATIALRAAAEKPQRFARMVLQGGFARRRVSPVEKVLSQFARYAPGRMSRFKVRTSLRRPGEANAFARVPPENKSFMRENCDSARISTVARYALVVASLDLRPLLRDIRLPVRLIGGEFDSIIPRECEEELLEGLPSVERMEIPACGHLPQYTHPGLLAQLTREFFTPDCGRVKHDDCPS